MAMNTHSITYKEIEIAVILAVAAVLVMIGLYYATLADTFNPAFSPTADPIGTLMTW